MNPNFENGDYLVINEIGYRFSDPKRGDVVVFRPPQGNIRQFYIKRIIGLPGETVKIEGGKVLVGGDEASLSELSEEYIKEVTPGNKSVSLGDDEYFVLGDNRNASSDSRIWGGISRSDIIGRAWIRAWPISEFEKIKTPSY